MARKDITTLEELIDYIPEYTKLEQGWDGYGGDVITPLAVHQAQIYLRDVMPKDLPLPWSAPSADGAVNIDWEFSDNKDFHIWFMFQDSGPSCFLSDRELGEIEVNRKGKVIYEFGRAEKLMGQTVDMFEIVKPYYDRLRQIVKEKK